MATMDVTPQELRDVEIREAWRGYHRDDVDELLERAAATIEALEDQVRQAQLRATQAPSPPPPRPVAPPPAPAPAPAPTPERRPPGVDTDVIQRTLVLAQKAADEAVAEARGKAHQMLAESEAKAQAVVSDAEAAARRIAETERRRLEDEIVQLTGARDTLNADVDALERFETEFKNRLREAIHAELDALESAARPAGDRPSVHAVHVPAPRSWSATSWSDSSDSLPGAARAGRAAVSGHPDGADPGRAGPRAVG